MKLRGSKPITLLAIILLLAVGGFCEKKESKAVHYVSKNGDDTNPGTRDAPWLTIAKAANTLVAGDTVYIKSGTYNEQVVPKNSGTEGNDIVYIVYPGDTVTIDGTGILIEWSGLFYVENKSHIKISGLRIINSSDAGVLVEGSSNIIIEKNYTNNTGNSGIGIWSSNHIIIDSNEVELAGTAGRQECITVAGTDLAEVKNNHVHHGKKEGICIKDGASNVRVFGNQVDYNDKVGIYLDAWDKHTYNIEVFQNIVHDIGNDGITLASEMGGLLENVKVYNNVSYNNTLNGLSIVPNGLVADSPMENLMVINNTFYDNGVTWGGGITVDSPNGDSVFLRNNICSENLIYQMNVGISGQNLIVDHNLIDGYRGYETEIYGSDSVVADPKFRDAALADFHLQKDSPAIDAGFSLNAPNSDYDGNARPQGSGFDIGAFEHLDASVN